MLRIDVAIMPFELNSGFRGVKEPVDFDFPLIAISDPSQHLSP
jgi:hypothetical protein